MYVCLCRGVTDHQIRAAVENGAQSVRAVRDQLGVMTQCGKCACLTREIVQDSIMDVESAQNLFFAVA